MNWTLLGHSTALVFMGLALATEPPPPPPPSLRAAFNSSVTNNLASARLVIELGGCEANSFYAHVPNLGVPGRPQGDNELVNFRTKCKAHLI